MIGFSEYKSILEKNEIKLDNREYNDVLKKMGVMNEDGKVNLDNMVEKINKFLESDGNKEKFLKDVEQNKIDGEKTKVKAKELKPGQSTIFLDKVISRILSVPKFTKKALRGKVKDQDILISEDNYIIDGHHRWCSAFLLNPDCKIKCTRINLPIEIALPILNGILSVNGAKEHQSGEDKYDIYKFLNKKKWELSEILSNIVEKISQDGLWGTGEKSPHMIGDFFKKMKKKLGKHFLNHIMENIMELPSPHPDSAPRKEMPQFKKNEINDIIKEF